MDMKYTLSKTDIGQTNLNLNCCLQIHKPEKNETGKK